MSRHRSICALWLLALLLIAFFPAAAQTTTRPSSSVPGSRLAHLRHGINLSEWFAQVWDPKGYTKQHFDTWTTSADITLIKSLGFDHVRLSINPQPLMEWSDHHNGTFDFSSLDGAVRTILDAGLAVELDVHPDSDFKARLASQDDFVERFTDFWRVLARQYSAWDPDLVFFEILNEPEFRDAYRWYGVETKIASAIRQSAQAHTIIAAGAHWDDDDDLIFLEPLPDPNVIYTFHFYQPHLFTHQGATWSTYYLHWLKGLHYPSSPENAANVAAQVPEARDRLQVIRYGQDHWNASRIEAEINQVADWARQRHVPLICNEFGVYRNFADPHDRAAWISDVRSTLERHSIGWAMWDYSGSFGLVTKKDGKATPAHQIVMALGLK